MSREEFGTFLRDIGAKFEDPKLLQSELGALQQELKRFLERKNANFVNAAHVPPPSVFNSFF